MAQVVFTSIWNAMYLSPGKAYTYITIYECILHQPNRTAKQKEIEG